MPKQLRYVILPVLQKTGRPRLITPYLRELIWRLYHEPLMGGQRQRSHVKVAEWLDAHNIKPPMGGEHWSRATIQRILQCYRKDMQERRIEAAIDMNKYQREREARLHPPG
jgi:hypothetical protein